MLNQNNKRKIDSLRDILVGKVPDPKSQIEQIMIALLYKFMNDMDLQAKEYGGEPSFFVKDFKKFSWEHIFSSKVSGVQLVELYSEGIESMETNPNIPQLFRDIFKNALLTYKDPETLRLFLNQINEFTYTADSEQLGDAFEYLLNFLSSQGDAGQFRTPRHIIDFIVEIVNPNKDNSIVDPASGTSGFLISAFNLIERLNTNEKTEFIKRKERTKIMSNIVGYDISPDMVRIGLANMYLHGFSNPKVYEYDALTSEERWNEYFDIVLANPPFFTPKGELNHIIIEVRSSKTEFYF